MTRCYKCGKKIDCSKAHEMALADNGFIASGKYTVCSDCRDTAIKNFKEFMEQEVEDA